MFLFKLHLNCTHCIASSVSLCLCYIALVFVRVCITLNKYSTACISKQNTRPPEFFYRMFWKMGTTCATAGSGATAGWPPQGRPMGWPHQPSQCQRPIEQPHQSSQNQRPIRWPYKSSHRQTNRAAFTANTRGRWDSLTSSAKQFTSMSSSSWSFLWIKDHALERNIFRSGSLWGPFLSLASRPEWHLRFCFLSCLCLRHLVSLSQVGSCISGDIRLWLLVSCWSLVGFMLKPM